MKEYCVDLEIAKELKENEFPQRIQYCFVKCERDNEFEFFNSLEACMLPIAWDFDNKVVSPISDEILKELPTYIYPDNIALCLDICIASDKLFLVRYKDFAHSKDFQFKFKDFTDFKLSNCLAKMWLYLKKEGYIK